MTQAASLGVTTNVCELDPENGILCVAELGSELTIVQGVRTGTDQEQVPVSKPSLTVITTKFVPTKVPSGENPAVLDVAE